MRTSTPKSSWISFIVLGVGLCVFALVGIFEVFGPIAPGGRGETLTWIGIPAGIVAIILGIREKVRERRR